MRLSPLMAIVDADFARGIGWTMPDLASAYVDGGARLLQVRAKQAPSGWLFEMASAVVAIAHGAHARVIINDRADVARLSGADGVHIGQEDLAPQAVRRVLAAEAIVGLSTHTAGQLEAAVREAVTYVAVGPVFATVTKATGYDGLGLEAIRRASERLRGSGLPLVAIGGVTLETAPDVLRAGADCVAVIGDLGVGGDPAARVREYLKRLTV